MLGELKGVSQTLGVAGSRRWFADEEMDLIVWYGPSGDVTGFQLCYDKTGAEHAFTWRAGGRAEHAAVDQGEDLPTDNRSPVLGPAGAPPAARVLADFTARSAELDAALRRLVGDVLRDLA